MSTVVEHAPHVVYRIYDDQDRLIYVGCTIDLDQRVREHWTLRWWAPQINRIETDPYPSRSAGRAAEAEAIRTLHPRWNLTGHGQVTDSHAEWSEQNFIDRATAMHHSWRRNSLSAQILAAQYRARFGRPLVIQEPAA